MRISDWSSDVCSSDLVPVLRQDFVERLVEPELAPGDQFHCRHAGDRLGHRIYAEQAVWRHGIGVRETFRPARNMFRLPSRHTNGSATSRERECKYVKKSVVAE